jgi:hypothetical protein
LILILKYTFELKILKLVQKTYTFWCLAGNYNSSLDYFFQIFQ